MKIHIYCRNFFLSVAAVLLIALLPATSVSASPPTTPPPPNEIVLIGGVDNLRHVDKQAFGTIRAQYAYNFHGVRPFTQVGLAHGGSVYGGVGALYDFHLTRHTSLTIASGPGLYRHKGNDPDLGYAVEFASWVELSTIVMQRRIGITFGHLSNAHLGSRNPGTETLGVTLHFPAGHGTNP